MKLPKEVEKGLKKIERLDIKKKSYSDEVDTIGKMQPLGQPYPAFERALDKLCEIAKKQAVVWNEIKNYIIPGTNKTLWQIAIVEGLNVHRYGVEEYLDFYGKDIRNAIKNQVKA